jgi:hypothetical protein
MSLAHRARVVNPIKAIAQRLRAIGRAILHMLFDDSPRW